MVIQKTEVNYYPMQRDQWKWDEDGILIGVGWQRDVDGK
jgi:hypothetical protein